MPSNDRVTALRNELRSLFDTAISTAFPDFDSPAIIAIPSEKQAHLSDYQCNNAMSLFGRLKKSGKAPASAAAVAEAILSALPPSELISEARYWG